MARPAASSRAGSVVTSRRRFSGRWRRWLLARCREPVFTLRGPVAVGPLQLTGLKGRFGLTLQLGYFGIVARGSRDLVEHNDLNSVAIRRSTIIAG